MIRVIIADDHHLVRQGLGALLAKADDIRVIGEAANGEEAVSLVESLQPDVVVMDVSMPRLDGRQATERIKTLNLPTQIVILSMHSDVTLVKQLLHCGIRGYLLKRSVSDELLLAIRAASRGEVYLSPAISDSVMSILLAPPTNNPPQLMADLLTPREQEVLQLIAEGHTNNAVAELLTISVKTVEKHRANLMAKLNVNDLPALMRKAMKHGLIFPES
ncbi:MAG: response regulator transcription factor [Chloroflexota bacterium]|jgi:DNA-binding NarL/FixJ family response regulator